MCEMPATTDMNAKAVRKSIRTALLRKEWVEQRWRFALGAIVLSTLLAGMLRAQVIPGAEAAVLIFWPAGVMLAIFLAMGPVASERSDRTWDFLTAQPISRSDVLMAKWRLGLYQLIGIMLIATLAGAVALWSRGTPMGLSFVGSSMESESLTRDTSEVVGMIGHPSVVEAIGGQATIANPVLWLLLLGLVSTIALACFYTPVFFILVRARNEFAAGLGGIFLAIAVHLWLLQFVALNLSPRGLVCTSVLLNPLAPLVLIWRSEATRYLPILPAVHVVLWIVLPCVLVKWFARKAVRR